MDPGRQMPKGDLLTLLLWVPSMWRVPCGGSSLRDSGAEAGVGGVAGSVWLALASDFGTSSWGPLPPTPLPSPTLHALLWEAPQFCSLHPRTSVLFAWGQALPGRPALPRWQAVGRPPAFPRRVLRVGRCPGQYARAAHTSFSGLSCLSRWRLLRWSNVCFYYFVRIIFII